MCCSVCCSVCCIVCCSVCCYVCAAVCVTECVASCVVVCVAVRVSRCWINTSKIPYCYVFLLQNRQWSKDLFNNILQIQCLSEYTYSNTCVCAYAYIQIRLLVRLLPKRTGNQALCHEVLRIHWHSEYKRIFTHICIRLFLKRDL